MPAGLISQNIGSNNTKLKFLNTDVGFASINGTDSKILKATNKGIT
jgi:hypothetical protein